MMGERQGGGSALTCKQCLDLILDPLVVIDSDYNVVGLNSAAEEVFGDFKGGKCYEYIFGFKKPCWNYSGYFCPIKETLDDGDVDISTFVGNVKVKDRYERRVIRNYRVGDKFVELYLPYKDFVGIIKSPEKGKKYDDIYIPREELEKLVKLFLEEGKTFYLTVVNIKKLKYINEIYGIPAGDLVIRAVEQVLSRLALKFNFKFSQVAGGFFLVLPFMGLKDIENFERELLNQFIHLRVKYFNTEIKPRVDITTVEIIPNAVRTLEDVYKLIFYAEKQHRLGQISHFFADKQKEFLKLLERKGEAIRHIQQILEERRVTFFLQPIVDLSTEKIFHFEVLMRFIDNGKIVSAGVYIDLIYELGLIVEFDYLLLNALREKKELLARLGKPIFLNISDEDLKFISYRKGLKSLLDEFESMGIPVSLEITEQILFKEWGFIETLADRYQLKFAIDDFGTGYSSLRLVADLITKGLGNYIKLDCSLIKEFPKNEYIQALVESIATFAKKTDLKLVGECVETEEHKNLLKKIGVHYGQGWYFYKPMPLEEILKLENL
ncbi:MAG TPA: EAL domain-containing protein [Aquifex sp.]|nr:EAL domain-containing protein [Aquifex sp.]